MDARIRGWGRGVVNPILAMPGFWEHLVPHPLRNYEKCDFYLYLQQVYTVCSHCLLSSQPHLVSLYLLYTRLENSP